jgi:hypothetical protein
MRIGDVSTLVQLDTGLQTNSRSMVMINEALLQQLRNAGIAMSQVGSDTSTNCQGLEIQKTFWQVESTSLVFTTRDGEELFEYGPPLLAATARNPCSVDSASGPHALLSARFLPRWGTVIFDGPNERVWVPKHPSPVSVHPAYHAMALAWNDKGGWILTTGSSVEEANASSLLGCNKQNGNCRLTAAVGPFQFLCLGIAGVQNKGSLNYAVRASLKAARSAALEACQKLNNECETRYAGCNG